MPAKRKELGNYKEKINEYFRDNKNVPTRMTKTGLNLALGIDRKYIFDCRRYQTKWQQKFLKDYDKACQKIANYLLRSTMQDPKYQWEYLRKCHPEEFDDLQENYQDNTTKNNIIINICEPRKIENDD
ncbi:hypothetical protein [Spiroplasma endosymbiont of Colias croceus]|uniref:hypothetical protein n=1 Tax=Spiroplasma endosymbiont of Colias croceus TaxID=3066310 RepID=UPI0030D1E1AE